MNEIKLLLLVLILCSFTFEALAQPQKKSDSEQKNTAYEAPDKVEINAEAKQTSLKEALANAYKTNPSLKAAQESQAALKQQLGLASANFKPNISAGYEKGRERTKRNNGSWVYESPVTKSAQFSQPIFRGGRSLSQWQSTKENVAAGEARLLGVEQNIFLSVVNAYSDVVEKQSVMDLAKNNVDVLSKHLKVVKARFSVGELTSTDVAQAQARFSKAEADARQSEGDLKTAKAGFSRIVGYEPENLLADMETPELPATLTDAKEIAKALNPEVIAATKIEEATGYDEYTAYGALLPTVTLDGSVSRSKSNSFLGGVNFDDDSLMLNIRMPLYQSGAEYARISEAKNKARESKYLTMDAKLSAVEAATKSYEDYQSAIAVIASTKSAIVAAEKARDGVSQESNSGTRTIVDLLDAEQELFSTRVNLVRAERVKIIESYRLLAATGKLTADNLQLQSE